MRVAMVQMGVVGGDREGNVGRAVALIGEAAGGGAEVAVLPECMDLGWTHPSSEELADEIPDGVVCRALREAARESGVYVCSGLTERSGEGVYNAAVLIDPEGEVVGRHRKVNELAIGEAFYGPGEGMSVVETALGRVGLMICADGFAEGLAPARELGALGAEVVLSPCAWAVEADHDNDVEPYGALWRDSYVPVAREFGMAIVGVSNVGEMTAGPWAGRRCIGCSLAIGRAGEELVQGPYGVEAECVLYLELELGRRAGG
ncbi:MAG: carbon-nitrogen hydrolase family protein [Verrucomicrobiota bacterium]